MMGWTPDVFWLSTPYDLVAAYEGWLEVNTVDDGSAEPMTRGRLAELIAEHA